MPGFRVPKKRARLDFEGIPDFEGAEVVLTLEASWEDYIALEAAIQELQGASRGIPNEVLRLFGDVFVEEWNFEDDSGPLPPNGESMLKLPPWTALLLLKKWREAMEVAADAPGPLGAPSTNGKTVEAPSLLASSMPASSGDSAQPSGSP